MKRLGLVCIVMLLLLPGALAEISDVSFLFEGEELGLIGSQVTIPITIQAELTNTDNLSLFADVTALNKKPSFSVLYANKSFDCSKNINNQTNETTSTTCFADVDLLTSQSEGVIIFEIQTNVSTFQNYSYSFTIDDTNPEVSAITTQFKKGDTYLVASTIPTEVYFDITDTVGSFDMRNVFMVSGDGVKSRMINCTSSSCTGLFVGSCQEDSFVDISVGNPSTDDAGNDFKGVAKSVFKCDALPPEMKMTSSGEYDVDVYFDDSIYPNPKTGDTIVVSAFIEEDASDLVAYANLSNMTGQQSLQEGSCEIMRPKLYNCSWTLANILDGENHIAFVIKDGVGRALHVNGQKMPEAKFDISVDYFETNASKETPDFFMPAVGLIAAEKGYNRVAVDLAIDNGYEYPIYATYTLRRSNVGGKVELLHSSVDPYVCTLRRDDGLEISAREIFSEIEVLDPLLDYTTTNRLNLVLSPGADVNDLDDEFDIVCNMSLLVRENDRTVYADPVNVPLVTTIKFKNSALGDTHPGEHFAQRIIEKEKSLNGVWKYVGILNNLGATLNDVCNIDRLMSGFGTSMLGIQLSGVSLSQFTSFGNSVTDAGMKGQDVQRAVNGPITEKKSAIGGLIDTACQWSTCSLDANAKKNGDKDWLWGGDTPVEQAFGKLDDSTQGGGIGNDVAAELLENVNVPNPQESFISAVQTRCFPAMVYHVNQYREIQCNELMCMKQQAVTGMDVGVCSVTKAQSVCVDLVGEAFDATPGLRQTKNLMDNANAFTQNLLPNALKIVMNNVICKDVDADYFAKGTNDQGGADTSLTRKAVVFACNLPESIGTQMNMQIKTTSSADYFRYPSNEDVCAIALCNDANPQNCAKSAGWLKDKLNINIPGTNMKIKPTVERRSISYYKNLINNYENTLNDQEKSEEYLNELKAAGLVGRDVDFLSSTEINTIQTKLDNQIKMAGELGETAELIIDDNGELYLSNIKWSDYTDTLTSLQTLDNRIDRDAYENADMQKYVDLSRTTIDVDGLKKSKAELEKKLKLDGITDAEKQKLGKEISTLETQISNQESNEENLKELKAKLETAGVDVDDLDDKIKQRNDFQKRLDKELVDFKASVTAEVSRLNNDLKDCKDDSDCKKRINERLAKINTLKNNIEDEDPDVAKNYLTEYLTQQRNLQNSRELYAKIAGVTDSVTSLLMSTGILNYGVLSNYGSHTVAGQVSDFADTYFNSENMIEGICSLKTRSMDDSVDSLGGAMQCVNGLCQPVLTHASEVVDYNSTHKLYTLVYALGPVRQPTAVDNLEPMKYSVVLKSRDGVDEKRLFKVPWKELQYGESLSFTKAFVAVGDYSEVCLQFSRAYPPNEYAAKLEYCRDIVEGDRGDTYFDTGSPVADNYGEPSPVATGSSDELAEGI